MPRNNRQVAAAIAAAGDQIIAVNGQRISRREALAHLVWNAMVEGEVTFVDGRVIQVDDMDQWLALIKWVGAHLDGPPVTLTDSRSLNAVVRVVYEEEPAYPPGAEPVAGSAVYGVGS
jgi:hypothetical protein